MGTHDMETSTMAQCFKCGQFHPGSACTNFTYPSYNLLPDPPLGFDEQMLTELRAIRALLERLVAKN